MARFWIRAGLEKRSVILPSMTVCVCRAGCGGAPVHRRGIFFPLDSPLKQWTRGITPMHSPTPGLASWEKCHRLAAREPNYPGVEIKMRLGLSDSLPRVTWEEKALLLSPNFAGLHRGQAISGLKLDGRELCAFCFTLPTRKKPILLASLLALLFLHA